MKTLLPLASALMILGAASAPATADDPVLFDQGRLSFDYAQFPVGPYAGTFSAEGPIAWPPEFPVGSGSAYGLVGERDGEHTLVVAAGVRNLDGTVDAAFLYLQSSVPFEPGTYPLDPTTYSVTYGFVDGASQLALPENPHEFDWANWSQLVVADHMFVGFSGSITLTDVESDYVAGRFIGYLGEYEGAGLLLALGNGEFEIGVEPVGVEATSWSSIKAAYQ